jgi:hypothetical protein
MKVTLAWWELQYKLSDLPGETEIFVDMGDLEMYEVRINKVLPATKDHPVALILELGQVWNEERDMDRRIDKYHES